MKNGYLIIMIKQRVTNVFNLVNIGTLIFALVVAIYLFIPPQIGLADSADFGRITTRLGIGRPFESPKLNFFNYYNSLFPIVSESKIPLNNSQLIAYFALQLNKLFYSKSFFSIYFLSALYYLGYVFGFHLLLRNTSEYFKSQKQNLVFIVISIIILSDIMFISYFNSFYQESFFLVAGLYIIAITLNKNLSYNWLLVWLLVLTLSKNQNLIFLILPLSLAMIKWHSLNKILILICTIGVFIQVFYQLKEQQQTNEANIYEAVFLGVLLKADGNEQKDVLKENGLDDPNYLKNVGKGYWRPENDLYKYDLENEFYSKINNLTILRMYFYNPKLFMKTGTVAINSLMLNSAQPEHLGNLTLKDSISGKKTIKKTFLGKYLNMLIIPGFILIFLFYSYQFICFGLFKEAKLACCLLIFIPLIFLANFVAGGINDFSKHNLSVYYMFGGLIILFSFNLLTSFKTQIKPNNLNL